MFTTKPRVRILSLALCAVLILSILPLTSSVASCNHSHDASCGYREDSPCGHICDDGGCQYEEAQPCDHPHDETCGEDGNDCAHDCAGEGCSFSVGIPCGHAHSEPCGYAESSPCGHQHDANCGGQSKADDKPDGSKPGSIPPNNSPDSKKPDNGVPGDGMQEGNISDTTSSSGTNNTEVGSSTGSDTPSTNGGDEMNSTLQETNKKNEGTSSEGFKPASKELDMNDEEAVTADKAALTWNAIQGSNTENTDVTANLATPLPTSGANGTTISWSSSDTLIISTTGVVTRPENGGGDVTVTLTATISRGAASDQVVFTLIVKDVTLPILTGDVNITINPVTGEVTALASGGNTYSTGEMTYTWTGGAAGTGPTVTPTLGINTTCTVTASGAADSIQASVTVYRVDISLSGHTGTDAASTPNAYGKIGDQITINYTIDNSGTQENTLTYSGISKPPANVSTPGTSTSTYTITAGDATNGVITITVTFDHTDAPPSTNAPTITSGNSKEIMSGIADTFLVTATGDTPIAYSISGQPSGVTINSQTGLISITRFVFEGTYPFTITASNGVLPNATQDFVMTVKQIADLSINVTANKAVYAPGDEIIYTIKVTNHGPSNAGLFEITDVVPPSILNVGYSFDGQSYTPWNGSIKNAGITAGSHYTRMLKGTVSPTASGDITNTVSLTSVTTDPSLDNNTHSVTVTVKESTPPTITSANYKEVMNGAGGTFQVEATGTAPITYDLIGQPAGVSIDSQTGLITIAANTADGTHPFTITASNGASPDATQNFTLTVKAEADLSITISADKSKYAPLSSIIYTITVKNNGPSDVNSITITENISNTIGSREFSWDGGAYQPWNGSLTVNEPLAANTSRVLLLKGKVFLPMNWSIKNTVMVTSPSIDPIQENNTATVTVAVPDAPTITSANHTEVVSGTGGTFQVTATGDAPFTYTAENAPSGVQIDNETGLITIAVWTSVGSHTFSVMAYNSVGFGRTQTFTLTVKPEPVAPAITSADNTTMVNGEGGTFQVTASGDAPIIYSLTDEPAGVSVNSTTGLVSIAGTTAVGTYTFTVTASNGVNPDDNQSFTLTVTPAAPIIISPQSLVGLATVADIIIPRPVSPAGATIRWYDAAGTQLSASSELTTGAYYATSVVDDVESTVRTSVQINIVPSGTPDAPAIISPQTLLPGSKISDIAVPNNQIIWYASDTCSERWHTSQELFNGLFYAAQKVGNAESTARTPVEIRILGTDTYEISVIMSVYFAPVDEVYEQPDAQTVVITNTGTGVVRLTQPTATYYVLGALSTTILCEGDIATFTIQPKAGLTVGDYSETITVSGNEGASTEVDVSFSVASSALSPFITQDALPAGMVGTAYASSIAAMGSLPITWSVAGGSLPGGLVIDPAGGKITGTPTTAGTFHFTIKAENRAGGDTKQFTIYIYPQAHTVTFDANGGTPATQTKTITAPATTVDTLPASPARSGYTFTGWNTQANGRGTAFTASTAVTASITVYAQWRSVEGGNGEGIVTPTPSPTNITPKATPTPENTSSASNQPVEDRIVNDQELDEDGWLRVVITKEDALEAVMQSNDFETQRGHTGMGITPVMEFSAQWSSGMSVVLTAEAIETLLEADVEAFKLFAPPIKFGFDHAALASLIEQSGGRDVTITKEPAKAPLGEASALIGERPAYVLRIQYDVDGERFDIVDLGEGLMTNGIWYTQPHAEDVDGIKAVIVGEDGRVETIAHSTYAEGWIRWTDSKSTGMFGVGH